MKRSFAFLAIVVISVITGCAATPVVPFSEVGDAVDLSKLNDQHGAAYINPEAKNLLLFVQDMKAKKIISKSLEKINLNCLSDGRVSYVADISGMPSFISSFIALPKMRKYAYPIWMYVSIKIYNILGQLVKTLVDEQLRGGHHAIQWDGKNNEANLITTGLYIVRLQSKQKVAVKKMLLIK